jgi:hypothetical protein
MLSPVRRSTRSLRAFLLVVAVLALLSADLARVTPSFAKEIDVIGTVDCGQRSGKRCDIDDTLVLLTSDVTGELEPVAIDVTWIKKKLPGLDQDDEITLAVELVTGGKPRALSIVQAKQRSGTGNPGQVTGTNEEGKNPRRHPDVEQKEDQPKDNTSRVVAGGVGGTVRNLVTGLPISGATVRLTSVTSPSSTSTATTDANGAFSLTGLDPGTYQATVSASGFITLTQNVTVAADVTSQFTFSLAVGFADITFTLTWGATPVDLDAHLSGPAPGGARFHASFVDPNPVPYASLTLQDGNGFGPEQVVIRRDPGTGAFVPGEYRFWVHNFISPPSFSGSQGRVIVNRDAAPLGTFEVTGATGDPTLPLWHVVNLQVDAAGNVTVAPIQQFTAGDLSTILSPPYGSKPAR